MKTVITVATFVALTTFCTGHHGHPLFHQIEDIKKLPKEQWEPELRSLLMSRLEDRRLRNAIDDAIIKALEQLRDLMATGYPELGIPPLDPLYIEHYILSLKHQLINIELMIHSTTATKLSSFVIDKINNDLTNLKADFGVTLPQLQLKGYYTLAGEIPSLINLTGNGNYTLALSGLSTWGTVTLGSEGGSEDGAVFIQSLNLDFKLTGLEANFGNLMGGGAVGDLINDLISDSGPTLIEQLKPDVNEYIGSLVIGLANPILKNFTLKEILDILGVPH